MNIGKGPYDFSKPNTIIASMEMPISRKLSTHLSLHNIASLLLTLDEKRPYILTQTEYNIKTTNNISLMPTSKTTIKLKDVNIEHYNIPKSLSLLTKRFTSDTDVESLKAAHKPNLHFCNVSYITTTKTPFIYSIGSYCENFPNILAKATSIDQIAVIKAIKQGNQNYNARLLSPQESSYSQVNYETCIQTNSNKENKINKPIKQLSLIKTNDTVCILMQNNNQLPEPISNANTLANFGCASPTLDSSLFPLNISTPHIQKELEYKAKLAKKLGRNSECIEVLCLIATDYHHLRKKLRGLLYECVLSSHIEDRKQIQSIKNALQNETNFLQKQIISNALSKTLDTLKSKSENIIQIIVSNLLPNAKKSSQVMDYLKIKGALQISEVENESPQSDRIELYSNIYEALLKEAEDVPFGNPDKLEMIASNISLKNKPNEEAYDILRYAYTMALSELLEVNDIKAIRETKPTLTKIKNLLYDIGVSLSSKQQLQNIEFTEKIIEQNQVAPLRRTTSDSELLVDSRASREGTPLFKKHNQYQSNTNANSSPVEFNCRRLYTAGDPIRIEEGDDNELQVIKDEGNYMSSTKKQITYNDDICFSSREEGDTFEGSCTESIAVGICLGYDELFCGYMFSYDLIYLPSNQGGNNHSHMIVLLKNDTLAVPKKYNLDNQTSYISFNQTIKLLGKSIDNQEVVELQKSLRATLTSKEDEIMVGFKKDESMLEFTVTNILGIFFREICLSNKKHTNKNISNFVVSVPLSFNDKQKNQISEAIYTYTNVESLMIIQESEAIAKTISYKTATNELEGKFIFTLEIEVTKINMKILLIGKNDITLKQSIESESVSENLIDGNIERYLYSLLAKNNINFETLTNEEKDFVKNSCQNIRAMFHNDNEAYYEINIQNQTYQIQLIRSEFDSMNQPLIDEISNLLNKLFSTSGVITNSIDEIVLLGKPSQFPSICAQLEKIFKKNPHKLEPSIETITYGAAMMANNIQESKKSIDEYRSKSKKKPPYKISPTLSDKYSHTTGQKTRNNRNKDPRSMLKTECTNESLAASQFRNSINPITVKKKSPFHHRNSVYFLLDEYLKKIQYQANA